MAILYDARSNEFFGNLDQIGGAVINDARASFQALSALAAETVMDLSGHATAIVDFRGTFVATAVFEGSVNGNDYFPIAALNQATGVYVASVATTGTVVFLNVAGYRRVRVRLSAWTSGSALVAMRATAADFSMLVERIAATSGLSATGAAAAAVTLTLPAPGAGLFQFIDWIRIEHFCAALLTAAAAPVIVTTTNLPGTPAFNFRADAAAQGTLTEKVIQNGMPIRAITANTAVTVVCPATTGVLWRVAAAYRVGA